MTNFYHKAWLWFDVLKEKVLIKYPKLPKNQYVITYTEIADYLKKAPNVYDYRTWNKFIECCLNNGWFRKWGNSHRIEHQKYFINVDAVKHDMQMLFESFEPELTITQQIVESKKIKPTQKT